MTLRIIPEGKIMSFDMTVEEAVMLLHIIDKFIDEFEFPDEFEERLSIFLERFQAKVEENLE